MLPSKPVVFFHPNVELIIFNNLQFMALTGQTSHAEDAKHSQRGGFFTRKIFKEGDILTESYINKLKRKYKETAHQYNRRTAFKVLRQDYISSNEGADGQKK